MSNEGEQIAGTRLATGHFQDTPQRRIVVMGKRRRLEQIA